MVLRTALQYKQGNKQQCKQTKRNKNTWSNNNNIQHSVKMNESPPYFLICVFVIQHVVAGKLPFGDCV